MEEMERVNIVDVLLDDNNVENITMKTKEGETIEFMQVAVIPIGEDDLYCILKPITEIEGMEEDEAIVFKVIEDAEGGSLVVEQDEEIANKVFEEYYKLLEEQE